MSGEFDAAGNLATAGLAAGAIEGREPHAAGEGACLNCGAPLQGRFCYNCGQAAHPHRTLFHMVEELLHGVFHFDTKVWRTLPMLAFRPGTLTRNYTYGKRARYVSPLALFLLTIFLMFFAFSFVHINFNGVGNNASDLADARTDLAEAQRDLTEAKRGEDGVVSTAAVAAAEHAVTVQQARVARVEARQHAAQARRSSQHVELTTSTTAVAQPNVNVNVVGDGEDADQGTWQEKLRNSVLSGHANVNSAWPYFNDRIKHAMLNADLAIYKIEQSAYKDSFLLVPISLPFIGLLFLWKRGVTFYDHTVFALYALSFVSVLFVIVAVMSNASWSSWAIAPLLLIALPVHTYFHLKGAYALGWWSALWRTFFLLNFAWIALTIFLVLIILMGIAQ